MTVIDSIDSINDKLSDWIVHTSPDPNNPASVEQMKQVVDLHSQLDQLLTRLTLADLQNAGAALTKILADQGGRLAALSAKMASTANDIKTAETVISYAAQAVAAAAKLASVLA